MGEVQETDYTLEELFSMTGDDPGDIIKPPTHYSGHTGGFGEGLLKYILQVRSHRTVLLAPCGS
jgi:hypothetical protein